MNPVSNAQGDAFAHLHPEHGHRPRHHTLQPLEWLTLAHVGIFLVVATWAFGGQSPWVRPPLTLWGALGALITLATLLKGGEEARPLPKLLWWGAPVAAFNLLVLVASANPSFHTVHAGVDALLVNTGGNPHLPSSARPALARQALGEFDAIWIACFNVALVLRRRRAVRILLSLVLANSVALAVFGTAQKLVGARGLFFGAVSTPQRYFFASFVYHNHWGAFVLLMLGVALALTAYHARRRHWRDFFHSPAPTGALVLLLLALTVPLSASRSSTVLTVTFLSAGFAHWISRLIRMRRQFNESIAPPIAGAAAALVLGAAAIWYIAGPTIATRVALTEQQIDRARLADGRDARVQLYTDTWHMALDKPWFGWGMASYPHVFTIYNTRDSIDHLPVFYHDAHSDWLQALAEHGVVGATLLALCAIVPLVSVRRKYLQNAVPMYLLGGCALVVAYALLEFPFGNFAVVLSWWVCFFSALQYARLTGQKSGSANPFDVTP